jgi:hypothetical protein
MGSSLGGCCNTVCYGIGDRHKDRLQLGWLRHSVSWAKSYIGSHSRLSLVFWACSKTPTHVQYIADQDGPQDLTRVCSLSLLKQRAASGRDGYRSSGASPSKKDGEGTEGCVSYVSFETSVLTPRSQSKDEAKLLAGQPIDEVSDHRISYISSHSSLPIFPHLLLIS